MRSLSSVGLALSIVFGCLLLALLAELYYLLWCKKRSTTRPDFRNDYSTPGTRELLFIFCCSSTTNPSSSSSSPSPFSHPKPIETEQQSLPHDDGFGNVCGPGLVPRFLFTIMEETVEEMESEDVVSTKGKSLNDLFLNMESGVITPPYLTPRASPSLFTPPLTPLLTESCNGSRKEEISSFFETSSDAEFNRLVRSSPLSSSHSPSSSSSSPLSRFKFLRDAEEKLYKKKAMEIAETE
ncbi:hypothetical protein CARUB_v10024946mg [Capsella rubella]|uniref:Membrane lipoprotein n=1 Tax=Capsella rubella TaxID=81985 RepID=R0FZZ4_9BRAS|nr:uncharacterized protein LOC17888730 [Capsella rubella]EOA28717.1 hypothetical protein CARUB_v10024946mg [Capsella rubella]